MKLLTVGLFLCFSVFAHSQESWSDKTRVLPDELRKVPVALYIMHSPNPNYPEHTKPEDKSKHLYVWKHQTSVISPDQDLEVIKAGSYIWYNAEGWKQNVQYNKKEFAKRFNCPKAQLIKGQTFTFEKNYRWGSNLYGGDALWYVIAKDNNGNIYKGMALLETEGVMKNY